MNELELKVIAMKIILAFERRKKMVMPLMKMKEFSYVLKFVRHYNEQKKAGVDVESFLDNAENAIKFFELELA